MRSWFLEREGVLSAAAVLSSVALCVLFVDRPVALWMNARLYESTAFAVSEFILRCLDPLLFAAAVLWVALSIRRRVYRTPDFGTRLVIGLTGTAVALVGALVLKVAIGRSQVYPPFLQDHIYECRPFAASLAFMAFPSATMAALGAFAAAAGVNSRRERAVAAAILLAIAVAILVTSGHWLSDIIGGTAFGLLAGAAVARSFRRTVSACATT